MNPNLNIPQSDFKFLPSVQLSAQQAGLLLTSQGQYSDLFMKEAKLPKPQAQRQMATSEGTKKRSKQVTWSEHEDQVLVRLVEKYMGKQWKRVAEELQKETNLYRTSDQVIQHWVRVLNPDISRDKWTKEEDIQLIDAAKRCEPKQWHAIAKLLPGRTDIQIRYRLSKLKKVLLDEHILQEQFLP